MRNFNLRPPKGTTQDARPLSATEREIVAARDAGQKPKQIAMQRGCKIATVYTHLRNAKAKAKELA